MPILEVLQNETSVPLFEKIGDVCWICIVISKFKENREMFMFSNSASVPASGFRMDF